MVDAVHSDQSPRNPLSCHSLPLLLQRWNPIACSSKEHKDFLRFTGLANWKIILEKWNKVDVLNGKKCPSLSAPRPVVKIDSFKFWCASEKKLFSEAPFENVAIYWLPRQGFGQSLALGRLR